MRRWSLLVFVLAGCPEGGSGDDSGPFVVLDTAVPYAVGTRAVLYATLSCLDPQIGVVLCPGRTVVAIDVVSRDPSVVAVRATQVDSSFSADVTLDLLAPGTAPFTVTLTDQLGGVYTVDGELDVRVPNRLEMTIECDNATASSPYLVPAGTAFDVWTVPYDGATRLAGVGTAPPIDTGPFAVEAYQFGRLTLRAPATPASAVLTSPVDPTASLALQAYVAGDIDSIASRPQASQPVVVTPPWSRVDVDLDYAVADRIVCDRLSAFAERYHADVAPGRPCWLNEAGDVSVNDVDSPLSLYGVGAGYCAVNVTLNGAPAEGTVVVRFDSWLPRRSVEWDWENPLPQGQTLRAVHARAANDVWMVGDGGATVRWDGGGVAYVPGGTHESLLDVFSLSANDAWAVGTNGTIVRWNGASWSGVSSATDEYLSGVWGASASDVFAVGNSGTILRWNGTSWARMTSNTTTHLNAVWGAGGQVWAVGFGGTIMGFDGTGWARATSNTTADLFAVGGSGAGDVWALASDGSAVRWNGSAWQPADTGTGASFSSIVAFSTMDAWAASIGPDMVYHWDGLSWSPVSALGSRAALYGIGGTSADGLWAAGVAGEIVRRTAAGWTRETAGIDGVGRPLNDVWAFATDDVWAVGASWLEPEEGIILHRDAAGWSVSATAPSELTAVWGIDPSDVWAVGHDGLVMRYDGSWRIVPTGIPHILTDVWGSSAGNVWIVGWGGTALQWNGSSFDQSSFLNSSDFNAVWGTTSDDVWVLGRSVPFGGPVVWHWNGFLWLDRAPSGSVFGGMTSVWGTGQDDVYLVGGGRLFHWTGSLAEVALGLDTGLGQIWGAAADDVWIGGAPALHWDGMSWERIDLPAGVGAVHGTDAANVWATGANGIILRKP